MKKKFCVLMFLLSVTIVRSQDLFGEYYSKNGFCSNTINLWSDSTFFWEFGCEGRSKILSGKYRIKEDRIIFSVTEKDSFNLIYQVEWVDSLDNQAKEIPSMLFPAFILVDRNDRIIKAQEVICYNPKGNYQSIIDKRNGWLFFPLTETNELYFPKLSIIFKRFISIKVPEKPVDKSVLKITLNIESTFLSYSEVQYQSKLDDTDVLIRNNRIIIEDDNFTLKLEKK